MYIVICQSGDIDYIRFPATTDEEKQIIIEKRICEAAHDYFKCHNSSISHVIITLVDENEKTAVFYTFERVPETVKCVGKYVSNTIETAGQHVMRMQDLPDPQFPTPTEWW